MFTTLPLTNPILIFLIVLAIILFAPILLNKLRIPHIIGLILAGMVIGPNGVGLLARDSSFEIFGTVGLLYLMFLAGLEMNLNDFKKNKAQGITFGIYTFLVPMILGTLASYYLLHFSWITSILLASMYASHTLIAYPIISRYGVNRNTTVGTAIAGTIITVLGALLVLAIISGMQGDELNLWFWIKLIGNIILFCAIVIFTFPRLTRWFMKKFDDSVSQYIFVLALVFAASVMAQLAGLEGIIGAFLVGIVLNRYIPPVSPLMNRIEFVGNALFIPYFLIGVGMLINLRVVISNPEALYVAINMSIVATASKWIAALLTQKTFRLTAIDRSILFGLSNAQAAATLAAVLIGYRIGLFDENVLNGTIIMILVTCIISSLVTEKAARSLATKLQQEGINKPKESEIERILIPVANPATIKNLINLALLLKDPKRRLPLYALHVTDDEKDALAQTHNARMALRAAARVAAAADTHCETMSRYDLNIASGIIHAIKEKNISEVVIGLHHKANIIDTFFGSKTELLLKGTHKMVTITKCIIPINTITRIVVAVPAQAEFETGFAKWVYRVANISRQTGCRILFYGHPSTLPLINEVLARAKYNIRSEYYELLEWENLIDLSEIVLLDDLFVVISARHTSISYNSEFEKLPIILSRHFSNNNLALIYPDQFGQENDVTYFSDPRAIDIQHNYTHFVSIRDYLKRMFDKLKTAIGRF